MPSHFPSSFSFRNTVIGGERKKGGHAFDDDKPPEWLIILVQLSTSDEEGSLTGHAVGCGCDLLLAPGKVVKWRL